VPTLESVDEPKVSLTDSYVPSSRSLGRCGTCIKSSLASLTEYYISLILKLEFDYEMEQV
jgi:hypothetical protein